VKSVAKKQKMKKSFTLIELVVAVALFAMVFAFTGMIFKVCINSYRTAGANAEIIQKLRAITDQLNADFKGIRTDAPLLIWFYEDSSPTNPNRYDQIMFFADGDFQSTQLYDYGLSPVVPSVPVPSPTGPEYPVMGNVARIFYGQAQPDPNLLARRQHILTADLNLDQWPPDNMLDFNDFAAAGADKRNERYEHDSNSLAQWKIVAGSDYDNEIIPACFNFRPYIHKGDPNTFQKLMCEGVGSFAIQWAYWDSVDGKFYWYPSSTHFINLIGNSEFGVFFNVPAPPISYINWYSVDNVQYRSGSNFLVGFYPKALKFTFTLYDSKAVFKEGRTFTHIVYLGN